MPQRPQAIAFDLLDTIFDTAPLAQALAGLGLPPRAHSLWLARTLQAGFALAASGSFRPFDEVARSALAGVVAELGNGIAAAEVDQLATCLRELPAHRDVAPALSRARAAGVPAVALTICDTDCTRELLGRSGIAPLLEGIVSIDDVQQWKPRPEVYWHVVRLLGVAGAAGGAAERARLGHPRRPPRRPHRRLGAARRGAHRRLRSRPTSPAATSARSATGCSPCRSEPLFRSMPAPSSLVRLPLPLLAAMLVAGCCCGNKYRTVVEVLDEAQPPAPLTPPSPPADEPDAAGDAARAPAPGRHLLPRRAAPARRDGAHQGGRGGVRRRQVVRGAGAGGGGGDERRVAHRPAQQRRLRLPQVAAVKLRVRIVDGKLQQDGVLHKAKLDIPFTIVADVSPTADGQLRIHPRKVSLRRQRQAADGLPAHQA